MRPFQKQMPKEVDYAIEVAEKVIAHLIPAIKPNVQQIVRDIDIAALAPDYAGVINLIGGHCANRQERPRVAVCRPFV